MQQKTKFFYMILLSPDPSLTEGISLPVKITVQSQKISAIAFDTDTSFVWMKTLSLEICRLEILSRSIKANVISTADTEVTIHAIVISIFGTKIASIIINYFKHVWSVAATEATPKNRAAVLYHPSGSAPSPCQFFCT